MSGGPLKSTGRWPTGRGEGNRLAEPRIGSTRTIWGVGQLSQRDSKTEKPTERRRKKAQREGQATARSPEVSIAFSFLGAYVIVRSLLPAVVGSFVSGTQLIMASAGSASSTATAVQVARGMAMAGLLPFLAVGSGLALVSGFGQSGFRFAPGAMKPKISNLSLKKGLQRLKPSTALWEGFRTFAKLALGALLVYGPVKATMARASILSGLSQWLSFAASQASSMLLRFALLSLVLAGADYGLRRRRTSRSLRMSKDETKREFKQDEGDPMLRGQRRRRHQQLVRHNMTREVTLADVIIANPTHLAVALRYIPGEPAPRVVAKGSGELALKIKSVAYRNGVMVKEDKPLARAIFSRCKVGQFIPTALFEAVAVVLAAAYRRRRRGAL
jgi:flagellar biosynthetic protein FlhB